MIKILLVELGPVPVELVHEEPGESQVVENSYWTILVRQAFTNSLQITLSDVLNRSLWQEQHFSVVTTKKGKVMYILV